MQAWRGEGPQDLTPRLTKAVANPGPRRKSIADDPLSLAEWPENKADARPDPAAKLIIPEKVGAGSRKVTTPGVNDTLEKP